VKKKQIQKRIKSCSCSNKNNIKTKKNEHFCWYVVPEVMIGVPKYDQSECIAYIMDKLQENGFLVRYFHPNTILITWNHWVPSYVRTELKNKTGIVVNEYGVKIEDLNNDNSNNSNKLSYEYSQPNDLIINMKNPDILQQQKEKQSKKDYTPIKSYKPSGSLVYNDALLSKLNDKLP